MKRGAAILAALVLMAAAPFSMAAAPDPADVLKDPAKEAQARHIFHEVRCVVCQNESIDDSEAELAHDLRQLIRAQVAQGKSEAQIRAFLVSKYGDFILLKPRFDAMTAVIWIVPFAIVIVGLTVVVLRRPRQEPEPVLTPEEEARLKSLVDQGDA